MKKSLIALAALAATGAFAQSSVTLYGRAEAGVDLGYRNTVTNSTTVVTAPVVTSTTTSTGGSVAKPGFRVEDGGNQGTGSSRFGMRGTEDLGGGLKANFVLEAAVNLDDGSTAANLFARAAWVGLSGNFGDIRLGRLQVGSYDVFARGLVFERGFGLYETGTTVVQGGQRFSNAVQYRSPNFGGISGTVSLSAPENNQSSTTPPASASGGGKTSVDLSLAYANGPIYVGVGYNKQDSSSTTNNGLAGLANVITNTSGPRTDYTISASYNFGVAQPFFNYTNRKDRSTSSTVTGGVVTAIGGTNLTGSGINTNGRQYALGVRVPIGAATLVTSFGTHKTTGSANALGNGSNVSVERKVRAFQIGALYPLSKRTTLQVNYGVNNRKDTSRRTQLLGIGAGANTTTTSESKQRGLNFGVSHLF